MGLKGVFTKKPEKADQEEIFVKMGLERVGIPSRYALQFEGTQVRLETQNGQMLALKPYEPATPRVLYQTSAVQAALGKTKLFAHSKDEFPTVSVFSMAGHLLEGYWTDWLILSATLNFRYFEYIEACRFPISDKSIVGYKEGAPVYLEKWGEALVARIGNRPVIPSQFVTVPSESELVLVLENKARGEALLAARISQTEDTTPSPEDEIQWMFLKTKTDEVLTKEWLAQAELVIFQPGKTESFFRMVKINPFQLRYDIPAQLGRPSDVAVTALEEIRLPINPTKEQVRQYVDAVVALSRKQKTSGYEDPQVEMLLKVGSQHLDVLMDAAPAPRSPKDLHLWKAMRHLVENDPQPHYLSDLLARLESKPDLAELLLKKEWIASARPVLLKGLRDQRNDLPASWIEALLSLEEPEIQNDVIAYYERKPWEPGLYEQIQDLPKVDLPKLVERAWLNTKGRSIRDQSFVIHRACELGILDALDTGASWLRNPSSDYQKRVGRAVLKRFTPAEGEDTELVAWYEAHAGKLRFDEERKIFVP